MGKETSDLEKKYLHELQIVYSLPEGEVVYRDKPDVIINGDRRIGIEITQAYIKDGQNIESEQRQKKIRERVVERSRSLYEKRFGNSPSIIFGFQASCPVREENELVEKIVGLVEVVKCQKEIIPRNYFEHVPELSFVYVVNSENSNSVWRVQQCYGLPNASKEDFQRIILIKNSKVSKYENCDEYWLLIVIDFFDRAQDQHLDEEELNGLDKLGFSKVIIFKTIYRQIVEL